MPIDKFEEVTTGMADVITVNSIYTGQVFKKSFTSLLKKPLVLYPPINFAGYDQKIDTSDPSVQILET
jgi:alpha-1,3/alpha-1,6-mannosyltransferase